MLFPQPHYDAAKFPEPRDFQLQALSDLRDAVRDGHRKIMLMSATGSGKTYIALMLIHEALKKGKRAKFLCDRTTLINQTSEVADSYGLAGHGIIQADHWRFDASLPFQIASVQTIARRSWMDYDLIIIDEAHTQYKAWTSHLMKTRAVVIGLSATPFSKRLGIMFTKIINASTMHKLTQDGVLVPFRTFSCTRVNMLGAETAGGEWTDRAVEQRGMSIIGDVVTEWQKFAEGRKTLVFGATISHCEHMCQQFNQMGILAMLFTSETKEAERKEILAEFRKPDSMIQVLLSVEALAKGFDVPDIGCICDVRPLRKSLSTFIQILGRGLRSAAGKKDCLLLDFSGNIVRFANDFSDIFYNGLDELDAGEKLDATIRRDEKREPSPCPACGYTPCGKRCISCGHERRTVAVVEHRTGTMEEIIIGKHKLADNRQHLYQQVCTYTRAHGNPDTSKQRAWYLFQKLAKGVKPANQWRFEDQPNVPITQAVLNHIQRSFIAYHRTKQ